MSADTENHKLSELRVVDLRSLLEKRGLDKSGNKQVLLERLEKALKNEGKNPETYQFEIEKKSAKRLATSSNQLEDTNAKDEDNEGELSEKVERSNTSQQDENKAKKGSNKDSSSNEAQADKKSTDSTTKTAAESDKLPQLTLEEADVNKSTNQDMKNTSSKNEDAAKGIGVNSEQNQDIKQEGNPASVEVSTSSKPGSKPKRSYSQNRNLWITNIAKTTRATELKQAMSAYGKVIGAKVVINAKYPGTCCYGYVTMDTIADADNCIAKLNNTELNGQVIRVEKVRPDHMASARLSPKQKNSEGFKGDRDKSKSDLHKSNRSKSQDGNKKETRKDDGDKNKAAKKGNKSERAASKGSKRKSRSLERSREKSRLRSGSKGSHSKYDRNVVTFDKIKEERERQRLRERERILREESKRSREESVRQDRVERMQRSEAARLDREREKLRIEREKLEREKAEIIRLERERQKEEREKIELEKLELHRVKMRLQEENHRPLKRPAPYRREGSYEDRKRMSGDRRYKEPTQMRFEPPNTKAPSPSKKFASSKSRIDFEKREAYPKRDRAYETNRSHPQALIPRPTSITKYQDSSVFNISRERDNRDARPREGAPSITNPRISKDPRFSERDRSPHYRPIRDERERRPIPDHKPEIRPAREHHYPEASKEPPRFDRNTGGNGWGHSGVSANKVFNTNAGSGIISKPWGKDGWRAIESGNSDRWNSGVMSRMAPPLTVPNFQGNSSLGMGPSCPPPPAINNYPGDRFDYKSMSNLRKY